ncbi:MAG: ISL3 family transposase [Bacteroidota bacterium]
MSCHVVASDHVCPSCGSKKKKSMKSYERRRVRDLDISGKEVWLDLRVRQFSCDCGRYFHERFEWVAPGKCHTRRQAKFIFECCAKQPFSEVGALYNIAPKTVERIYYEYAEGVINLPTRYAQLRKLGIDELSLRKGKGDYCCILVDLERVIELDLLPDRKKASIITHFEQLGPDFCQQIEEVCFDMWGPYADVAKRCFPNARLTIDRFHVVKALNEVLDSTPKALRSQHPKQAAFKSLKWHLFKPPHKLTDQQTQLLEAAFQQAPQLEQAYTLRNTFHAIFDQANTKEEAKTWLNQWIEDVMFTQQKQWDKFLKTLDNWKDPILNFVESRISNAATEGRNNLIRYVKRISFGMPNFKHLRIRVLATSR